MSCGQAEVADVSNNEDCEVTAKGPGSVRRYEYQPAGPGQWFFVLIVFEVPNRC
jgi:hypothetical protein